MNDNMFFDLSGSIAKEFVSEVAKNSSMNITMTGKHATWIAVIVGLSLVSVEFIRYKMILAKYHNEKSISTE